MKKEFDKCSVICPTCETLQDGHYSYRDLEFRGKNIQNILVSVCNECDTVCGIPQQSAEEIKKHKG